MTTTPPTSSDPTDRAAAVGTVAPRPLSPRNARVVELGRLSRQRRVREDSGHLVLDGPVLLREALAAGIEVRDVFVDPEAVERRDVAEALIVAAAAGATVWAVQGGLEGHVDPQHPNGVAAVARIPDAAAPAGAVADGTPLHLVLVGVSDPGNVGTLLRTAEAVGATSVVLTEGSVDPWAPKVVRASAGSVLRVPVRGGPAADELLALRAAGVRCVGTTGVGGEAPERVDLTVPTALVLGNEAHGLPGELAPAVDAWVSLPMAGGVESLNVAVAGSVVAFEAVRQRGRS